MKQKFILLVLAAICVFRMNAQQMLSQNFNSTSSVTAAGWLKLNNSSPAGATSWFIGNPAVFAAYNGPDSAYYAANYNSTTGSNGIISTWLISPTVTIYNGGVLQFATRTNTATAQTVAPDRLEVYLSTGNGTVIGTGSAAIGTFSTQLVTVNPNLTTTGYPTTWTIYTATLSSVTGTTTGRFGFRYFVTSAGPTGTNSSYVGIDDVRFTLPCPNPTLSVSSSTNNICSGSVITLTASGANTYTWSSGQTTSSANVVPTTSTIYTVTGSSTPNCNTTQTIAITVTVTPNLSVSDVTVCPGTAATLAVSGASSYSWSTGATTSSIVDTPTVNTTYSVTGFNGICEQTKLLTVTLGASLSVNSSASQGTICSGQSATITSNGASSYSLLPGTGSNTTNISVVTPTTTTTYTINGFSGSCAGQAIVPITVLPVPSLTVVGSPTLTSGNSVTLCPNTAASFTVSGATSYSWTGTANVTSIQSIITPTLVGNYPYTVVGTGTNNCSSTRVITVSLSSSSLCAVGFESIAANNAAISVFPNPFGNEFKINGVAGRVEVYNALGQLVLKQAVSDTETIRTESFAKGVYILKAYNADDKLLNTVKLIRN